MGGDKAAISLEEIKNETVDLVRTIHCYTVPRKLGLSLFSLWGVLVAKLSSLFREFHFYLGVRLFLKC